MGQGPKSGFHLKPGENISLGLMSEFSGRVDAVRASIQIMGLRNRKVAQLRPEDLVDVSVLQRLEQSGFVR